jgi:hypothetical protein
MDRMAGVNIGVNGSAMTPTAVTGIAEGVTMAAMDGATSLL